MSNSHSINIIYQYYISILYINIIYQYYISILYINIIYQYYISILYINIIYQYYIIIYINSGVSRISFRGGGVKFFSGKVGVFAWREREATRSLGGFGGMLSRENFLKWCNLVRFREYFAKILSKQ